MSGLARDRDDADEPGGPGRRGSAGRAEHLRLGAGATLDGLTDHDRVAACLVALAHLPGVGPATLLHCHLEEGASAAWEAACAGRPARVQALAHLVARFGPDTTGRLTRAARGRDPVDDLRRHLAAGRHVLVHGHPGYPDRLAQDPAPPAVLFATGRPHLLRGPTVAVVGTRNATRAGRDLAASLGRGLAEAGVAVVSGLALGIDGAAHRGALRSSRSGPTPPDHGDNDLGLAVGVVAGGLDIAYPRRHADLHREVAGRGLLVSETPLGCRPVPWRFPARNRIIAGLADALVVVESRSAGGSMLTVGEALDRGVTVLAVPGHPTAPASAGANDLLYEGATPVRDVDDVLRAIGIQASPSSRPKVSASGREEPPHPVQRALLDAIGTTPVTLGEVVDRSGLSLDEAAAHLVTLEADGRITRIGSWFERTGSATGRGPGARS